LIISASYKTDIPAFYSRWFLNRLNAGSCQMTNPYNNVSKRVSLVPKDVEAIIFWTKNAGPMLLAFERIAEMGHFFFIQYTITNYPRELESSVTKADNAVGHVKSLAKRWGRRCVVWRYDPILITSHTSLEWHVANFSRLAGELSGLVDEVVVSFAHFYKKTKTNLELAAKSGGFDFYDPSRPQKIELLYRLSEMARQEGIFLTVCSQPEVVPSNATNARCVDAERIADVRGRRMDFRTRGNRPGCECAESIDIGEYDTCPHGCVYCYAVRSRDLAKQRHHRHNPDDEFLFPRAGARPAAVISDNQLNLFGSE
jgi:hypothetical protein